MRKHLEIERKFLVGHPPKGLKRRPCAEIVQAYFPTADKNLEIRLRRKKSDHFITFKGGTGPKREEEEIAIPAGRFRNLWPLTRGGKVAKRRYKIPYHGHTIEVDVYQGPHRGLVTADIEFHSTKDSRQFKPPSWMGREITGERRFANAELARRGRLP